jgi:hypothetical protein
MGTFPERARTLRGLLAARQSPEDGGWPHRLDLANAATSIPSTAQVIEIQRAGNSEFRDASVQAGLQYLSRSVSEHTQPKKSGGSGRGQTARYPAFALWGLTRYPQAPFADSLRGGLDFAVAWLLKHRLKAGGWANEREEALSFTVTMPAVHALDRLVFHPEWGDVAGVLAARARENVVKHNRGSKNSPWWTPYGMGAKPSGAATAMAVLILAGGSDEQRSLARGGIQWLLNNPNEWVNHTETDMGMGDRLWQMMSFSLGLRAVLHPCAKESPSMSVFEAAVQYWDDLWVEEIGAWSHHPGNVPSTTGSFGVIVAYRALKRAFEFDPATHLRVKVRKKRSGGGPQPRPPLTVRLSRGRRRVSIVNQLGATVVDQEVRGPSQWKVLEFVALRHHEAMGSKDQRRQTVTIDELVTVCGSSPEACVRAIKRVNQLLTKAAERNHGQFLPALIEDMKPRGALVGYGFDEVDLIEFDDTEA